MYKPVLILLVCCASFCLSCGMKKGITHSKEQPFHLFTPNLKLKNWDFKAEFKKILKKKKVLLPYSDLVCSTYYKMNYQPVLVDRFLPQHGLQTLIGYLEKSDQHGLDSNLFLLSDIKEKLAIARTSTSASTLKELRNLAELELDIANALIRYSMTLQFGLVNPEKIYAGYSTPTFQADSNVVMQVFGVNDLNKYLDSIQPKFPAYLALQKALAINKRDSSNNANEIKRKLLVNLERLRWKNRPKEQKFVVVNIASFSLDVINKGKSELHMKVCVGEKGNWETPQLGSMIFRIQVNPVWNIPQSIVRSETIKLASQDRYYLANNNINVYEKGILIKNSESIDWSSAKIDQLFFQQQPGPDNALGRIKFLFENSSNVYLHDTPLQKMFDQKVRAVSHGCIRVEKPLKLAYALFDKGQKYQLIERAMKNGYPRAKFINLPQQIPIRLYYYTAELNNNNTVQYYKDIYDLDPVLYDAIVAN